MKCFVKSLRRRQDETPVPSATVATRRQLTVGKGNQVRVQTAQERTSRTFKRSTQRTFVTRTYALLLIGQAALTCILSFG